MPFGDYEQKLDCSTKEDTALPAAELRTAGCLHSNTQLLMSIGRQQQGSASKSRVLSVQLAIHCPLQNRADLCTKQRHLCRHYAY